MLKRREFVPVLLIFFGISIFSWLFLLPTLAAELSLSSGGGREFAAPRSLNLSRSFAENFNLPSLPFNSLLGEHLANPDFTLTIERLGIRRARVLSNLDAADNRVYLKELLEGLGHLKGSSLPGEPGTVFLFGHSSLPFLFSSSDYATIFSNLNRLKRGDPISVRYAGREFNYRVDSLKVVPAGSRVEDLTASSERLILLTCFPPGFLSERLIVSASRRF